MRKKTTSLICTTGIAAIAIGTWGLSPSPVSLLFIAVLTKESVKKAFSQDNA